MKKKLLIVAAIVVLCLTMFACGKASKSDYIGEWEMTEMSASGITITKDLASAMGVDELGSVVFTEDTASVTILSEDTGDLEWEVESGKIILEDSSEEMEGEIQKDGTIKFSYTSSGSEISFTIEKKK